MEEETQKETLGSQLIKVHGQNSGRLSQTIGETTREMAKEYIKSLEKVVKDHEKHTDPYFIMEIISPEQFLEGVIRIRHVARRTRPLPEWGTALYSVDNKKGEIRYEWGLPLHREAILVMENPGGWDPKIVKDIRDFVQGTLV